jgi:hypothetical protein
VVHGEVLSAEEATARGGLRRSPWHSSTGVGWRGSARRCSVAAQHSKARHSVATASRGVRERRVMQASEEHEDKVQLTWGWRRPWRPVAAALSARRGVEGAVTGIRCHGHTTYNRVRAV